MAAARLTLTRVPRQVPRALGSLSPRLASLEDARSDGPLAVDTPSVTLDLRAGSGSGRLRYSVAETLLAAGACKVGPYAKAGLTVCWGRA